MLMVNEKIVSPPEIINLIEENYPITDTYDYGL